MKFQLLVAAGLAGAATAAPGYSWSGVPSFPGATSTGKIASPTSGAWGSGGYPAGPTGTGYPPSGPSGGFPSGPGGPTQCFGTPSCYLTDAIAQQIISRYEDLINRNIHGAQFNTSADALLASTYSLTSNAASADAGLPLNGVTIPNKEVFKGIFSGQPTGAGETTLDIFHSCNKILWRWTGLNPDKQLVKGLSALEITSSFQIGPVYAEYFNPTLDRCSTS